MSSMLIGYLPVWGFWAPLPNEMVDLRDALAPERMSQTDALNRAAAINQAIYDGDYRSAAARARALHEKLRTPSDSLIGVAYALEMLPKSALDTIGFTLCEIVSAEARDCGG